MGTFTNLNHQEMVLVGSATPRNWSEWSGSWTIETCDPATEGFMSHEKTRPYFPLNTGCFIGIFMSVHYNPHITG